MIPFCRCSVCRNIINSEGEVSNRICLSCQEENRKKYEEIMDKLKHKEIMDKSKKQGNSNERT